MASAYDSLVGRLSFANSAAEEAKVRTELTAKVRVAIRSEMDNQINLKRAGMMSKYDDFNSMKLADAAVQALSDYYQDRLHGRV